MRTFDLILHEHVVIAGRRQMVWIWASATNAIRIGRPEWIESSAGHMAWNTAWKWIPAWHAWEARLEASRRVHEHATAAAERV